MVNTSNLLVCEISHVCEFCVCMHSLGDHYDLSPLFFSHHLACVEVLSFNLQLPKFEV